MECFVPADGGYPASRDKTSQHVCHFDIEQVGGMQALIAGINTLFDLKSRTRLK